MSRVVFDSSLVRNIGLTPAVIFSQENTCILESLLLCNQTSSLIKVSLYIAQTEPNGEVIDYPIQTDFSLEANQTLDWLYGKNAQFIPARQIWYGRSDDGRHLFNAALSYRLFFKRLNHSCGF